MMKEKYIDYLIDGVKVNFDKTNDKITKVINEGAKESYTADGLLSIVTMDLVLHRELNEPYRLNRSYEAIKKVLTLYNIYQKKNNNLKPIFNRMFGLPSFCKIMIYLNENGKTTKKDLDEAYNLLVDIGNWTVDYPEWGTHNRATARATAMYWSWKLFPNREMSHVWYKTYLALINDNLSKWSIEDASTYHPIWIADIMEIPEEDTCKFPNHDLVIQYYLNMITYIQNPLFLSTEYGDGRLGSQWGVIVYILEQGATKYNNGVYRYVARKIFEKMKSTNEKNVYIGKQFNSIAYAISYVNDEILEKPPYLGSLEVMDDVIGKKIVLKNGLSNKNSTFLFYNYKDEICNSVLGRRNLDETICAPAEKNHHGHPDENSINLLTYKNSVLLKDGGYRERLDLLGAFRADFYHNKLIVRTGKYASLIEALHEEQHCNKVDTEKIYFYEFDDFDVLRTRIYDYKHNVIYDRAIEYLKNENIILVSDIVKINKKNQYLFSNQYYSQVINELGPGLYQTYYEMIGSDELKPGFDNDTSNRLLIYYPQHHGKFHTENIRRSYTTEKILSEYHEGELKKNDFFVTTTVLMPNENIVNMEIIESIKVKQDQKGVSISLDVKGKHYELCHKLDEYKGFIKNRRPMYQYSKSKVEYKNVESDALFIGVLETEKDYHYAFVSGSKVIFKGQKLFYIKGKSDFYQANMENKKHIGSYPVYEDAVKK